MSIKAAQEVFLEGFSSGGGLEMKGAEVSVPNTLVISTLLPHFLAPRWRPTEQECCCRSHSHYREGSLCGFRPDLFLTNFKQGLNLEPLLRRFALPHSHKHQQFQHSGLHERKKEKDFFFSFWRAMSFIPDIPPSPQLAS